MSKVVVCHSRTGPALPELGSTDGKELVGLMERRPAALVIVVELPRGLADGREEARPLEIGWKGMDRSTSRPMTSSDEQSSIDIYL